MIEKLIGIFAKIAHDKALHLIGGVILFAAFHFISVLFALLVVAVVGAIKELYDYHRPKTHTCDAFDFLYTVAGGVIGYICSL